MLLLCIGYNSDWWWWRRFTQSIWKIWWTFDKVVYVGGAMEVHINYAINFMLFVIAANYVKLCTYYALNYTQYNNSITWKIVCKIFILFIYLFFIIIIYFF